MRFQGPSVRKLQGTRLIAHCNLIPDPCKGRGEQKIDLLDSADYVGDDGMRTPNGKLKTVAILCLTSILALFALTGYRYWAFKNRTIDAPENDRLMNLSQSLFGLLDHVPARLTAFGFAVVGNFEEAVTCWRRDAGLWKRANEGIILAAAAGAVGVQLGGNAAPGVTPDRSQTFEAGAVAEAVNAEGSTPGLPPELGHLRSIVGLVWRSVVLWMLLLALLSLANLVG